MMKLIKYLLVSVLILLSVNLFSREKEVGSGIESVTVFYQGAQISRLTTDVSLPAGSTVLVVKGLEQSLQDRSLRVGMKGPGEILNVVRLTDYLQRETSNEKITALTDRLKELDSRSEENQMLKGVYDQEKNLLISNMKLGGSNNGVTVAQIKEGADYYRSRLTEIDTKLLELSRKSKNIGEERILINKQLSELNYLKNRPTSMLQVTVNMKSAGTCGLLLDYFVQEAGWSPLYDLRINEVGDPVRVMRKASVFQSTGEDWTDVQLSFSTGNPSDQQVLPVLNPWYIDLFYSKPTIARRENMSAVRAVSEAEPTAPQMESKKSANVIDAYDMTGAVPAVETSSKNSILEFTLATRASVPSDNKKQTFSLGTETLNASYHYQAVPKFDKSAFLIATVKDWEEYELVDGPANIYYQGMFIGQSYLNASVTNDSLSFSLGKDKGIMLERKMVKDFTKTRKVGANIRKNFGYEIVARNTKKVAVDLVVEDQVPLSKNSQIVVDVDETGEGELQESTGRVTWKIHLEPGKTVSLPLRFSIRYPEGQQVTL